jgi:predicted CXXCH cytochrome family protein
MRRRLAAASIFLLIASAEPPDPDTSEAGRLEQTKPLDPAAWGSNHAGKPIPEYVDGDECLFCHRNTIGTSWQKNAHGITVRHRNDAPALAKLLDEVEQPKLKETGREIEHFLGSRHRVRFLKPDGHGKFALLNVQARLDAAGRVERWENVDRPAWDRDRFANRCAGCHTTAVNPATKSFSAFGLECYTCHGAVTLDHTTNTKLVWWSGPRRNATDFLEVQAMTSICAQCHLRDGRSRSTGLPYPNTFVAGDNLFQDFEVDFTKADAAGLNPVDRHVLRAVRDVVVTSSTGATMPTCLSCHRLHDSSTAKHRLIPKSAICFDCHREEGAKLITMTYTVDSPICEYVGVSRGAGGRKQE